MRTSEVAGRAGVNAETLRYYERRGLLPEPPRQESGYRIYGEDAVRMRATERDLRCKMITIDPETAALEPRVLREVVQTRQEGAGIYGHPEKAGILQVGMPVRLLAGD